MRVKKLGIAFIVIAAVSATLAGSAFAGTAVTEAATWVKTESGSAKVIAEEGVKCRQTEKAEPFVLKSKVLGSPVELTATGISCSGMKVKTTGSGESSMAIAEGQLTFEGISVMHPESCKTPATNTTNTVVADLQMNSAVPTKSFLKLSAKSGETIATVKLEGCGAAGSYPLKGTLVADATEKTGEHQVLQEFAGNETTHAMSSLKLGSEAATLTGVFGLELTSGLTWGAAPPKAQPQAGGWVQTNAGFLEGIAEETVSCFQTEGASPFVFRTKIFGGTVELTATGINCSGAKLKTSGTGAATTAKFEGQLEFTGFSVMSPVGCKTPATNKTNALVGELSMKEAAPNKSFLRFTPAAGEAASFTNLKIEGCAAAGSYPLKGNFYLEGTASTGEHLRVQEFAGNETTHAMSSFKMGSEPVTLTGEFGIELQSGRAWGSKSP